MPDAFWMKLQVDGAVRVICPCGTRMFALPPDHPAFGTFLQHFINNHRPCAAWKGEPRAR